ncbi:Uncharacterised protein [Mycobacteroides abscessus subsp. massiliense]|nr:Uncharacterised protein [Mycobacteroides abscessus subsp. massiliense]
MSSIMPCSSSVVCLWFTGPLLSRRVFCTEGGASINLRLSACGPRRPAAMPNSTF